MPTDPPPLQHQVRDRITASGLTHAELARRTGIKPPHIARFMHSDEGVTASTLDKLIKALGGAKLTWLRDRKGR